MAEKSEFSKFFPLVQGGQWSQPELMCGGYSGNLESPCYQLKKLPACFSVLVYFWLCQAESFSEVLTALDLPSPLCQGLRVGSGHPVSIRGPGLWNLQVPGDGNGGFLVLLWITGHLFRWQWITTDTYLTNQCDPDLHYLLYSWQWHRKHVICLLVFRIILRNWASKAVWNQLLDKFHALFC